MHTSSDRGYYDYRGGKDMKVGRNDKCPCGSGKKYKQCCLNKDTGINNLFILTKEVYEKDFLPVYNLDIYRPKMFIEFEVVLPFHIPMDISRTITLGCDEGYFSFRFDMVTTNDSYKYPSDTPILNIHLTKILMMAAVDLDYADFLGDTEKYYNYYFDIALEELNKIVISYMTTKKDEDCHYLTKEMLQSIVFVRTTDLETWENNMELFMLHPYVPFEKELLNENDIQEIGRMYAIVLSEINPFSTGERYALFARRYFKQGFYHEALLYAQISVEVFIRQLYKELLREVDGKTNEEINEILEDTSFMTIIKKKLPHYLGGNWDITKETTEAGKWHKNTYELRNKATHTGRIPTFSEADQAAHDAIEFRQFILKRIKANKKEYPKLNEYFM